jgi:hypothetical protein
LALSCGFCDFSQFNKAIRSQTGHRPIEYRHINSKIALRPGSFRCMENPPPASFFDVLDRRTQPPADRMEFLGGFEHGSGTQGCPGIVTGEQRLKFTDDFFRGSFLRLHKKRK